MTRRNLQFEANNEGKAISWEIWIFFALSFVGGAALQRLPSILQHYVWWLTPVSLVMSYVFYAGWMIFRERKGFYNPYLDHHTAAGLAMGMAAAIFTCSSAALFVFGYFFTK